MDTRIPGFGTEGGDILSIQPHHQFAEHPPLPDGTLVFVQSESYPQRTEHEYGVHLSYTVIALKRT